MCVCLLFIYVFFYADLILQTRTKGNLSLLISFSVLFVFLFQDLLIFLKLFLPHSIPKYFLVNFLRINPVLVLFFTLF